MTEPTMPLSTSMKVACAIAVIAMLVGFVLIFAPIIVPAALTTTGVVLGASVVSAITTATGIIGGGLLVAGMYGFYETVMNKDAEWISFWKQFEKGFVVGCISHAHSLIFSSVVGPIAERLNYKPKMVAMYLGSICGFVNNGISNLMSDRNFCDNWRLAMMSGATIGLVCQSLADNEPIWLPKDLKDLWSKLFDAMDEALQNSVIRIPWSEITKQLTKFFCTPTRAQCLSSLSYSLISSLALWYWELRPQPQALRVEEAVNDEAERRSASGDEEPEEVRVEIDHRSGPPYHRSNSGRQEERVEQPKQPEGLPRHDPEDRPQNGRISPDKRRDTDSEDRERPGNTRQEENPGGSVQFESIEQEDLNVPRSSKHPEASGSQLSKETEAENSEQECSNREEADPPQAEAFSHHPESPEVSDGHIEAEEENEEHPSQEVHHLEAEASLNNDAVHFLRSVAGEGESEAITERQPQEIFASTSQGLDNDHGPISESAGKVSSRGPFTKSGSKSKHNPIRRLTEAVGKAANKLHAKTMSTTPVIENNYISDLTSLLILHRKYSKMSQQEPPASRPEIQRVVNTAFDGTRLGVGVPSISCQAGPSSSSIDADVSKGTEKEKKEYKEECKEDEADKKRSIPDLGGSQPSKQPKVAKDGKSIASIHKLIATDEEGNYIMTDRNIEWPKFDGKMGVVALMGLPGSGTSTLACSILFQLGYAISEIAAFQTRLRVGVNAYVLHKHSLIIVECCEGIDPYQDSRKIAPYGGLLIELFVYINSRAVIWNVPFYDDDVGRVKEYLLSRLSALTIISTAHNGLAPRDVHLILRVHSENEHQHLKNMSRLEDSLKKIVELDVHDSGIQAPKSREEEWRERVIALHIIKVRLLKTRNETVNIAGFDEYDKQIEGVADLICTSSSLSPTTCDKFYDVAATYWTELVRSKTLEAATAQISGAYAKEADDCGAQKWFSEVNRYLKGAKNDKMKKEVEEYKQNMKDKGEEFKNRPKEGQTPDIFIESVLKMAEIILRGGLLLTDIHLREEGVALGLKGMALLLKANISPVIELAVLKIMFFELGLMEILKQVEIYSCFDDCWYLLYCLAHNGFPLLTMEFDFWTAAKEHLERTEFKEDFYRKSYSKMLWYLEEMTDTDASRCVPEKGGHCEDHFGGIAVDQIVFDFEKERSAEVENIVTRTAQDPATAPERHEKFMKLPAEWFEKSKYADLKFESEEARQKAYEMVIGSLSGRNFEILYNKIAMHFAKTVVKTSSLRTTLHDNVSDIGKMRLLIWTHVAGLAKHSLPLCLALFNNAHLLEFLLENYVSSQVQSEHFPRVLRLLCQLRQAEHCHRSLKQMKNFVDENCRWRESKQSGSNIHSLADFDQKRLDLAEKWTYTLLRCLESKVVGKLIPYFCQTKYDSRVTESLLVSLYNFLEEEAGETNYSESFYVAHRMDILTRVVAEFEESTAALMKTASGQEGANRHETNIHLQILRYGCDLINLMLAIFYKKERDEKEFFTDRLTDKPLRSSNIFQQLIRSAAGMIQFLPSANARSNSRRLEERNFFWCLHYYCLLLNLASLSGESYTAVLKKHGEKHVAAIDQDKLDNITYGVSQFKKVDVTEKKKMHHKLVIVASDLLLTVARKQLPSSWDGYDVMEGNLTTRIAALKKRLLLAESQRKQYKIWLDEQEQRRRKAENPPIQIRSYQCINRPEISKVKVKYAIKKVSYYLPGTGWRCTTSSPDFHMIKEGHMEKGETEGAAAACAFLLCYNMSGSAIGSEASKPLKKFLDLLEKLKDIDGSNESYKTLKLNQAFLVVKTILTVPHASQLLSECGYYTTTEGALTFLTITPDSICSSYIKDLHNKLDWLKDRDMRLRVCSKFTQVKKSSVETMEDERLPLAFFCQKTHEHFDLIHRLPINQLKKRRPHLDKVPRHLRYVLVRVTTETTVCYQAIFNPQETVARVLEQLKTSLGVTTTRLREKDSDQILPHDKVLGDFPYAVHLHMC